MDPSFSKIQLALQITEYISQSKCQVQLSGLLGLSPVVQQPAN